MGRPVALHRTYLTNDGHKAPVSAPKKIMKVHDLTGSAVRLFAPKDGFLAVCEGIEDAISAWLLWGIPCWACLGTSGLRSFIPPEGNHEVLILADSDGPGKKAAFELSDRLEEKKMAVRIWGPRGLKDINGVLRERNTK
jgi:putative DNA primase/helicase